MSTTTVTSTCQAVERLYDRMEATDFFNCFSYHLEECGSCRAFLGTDWLRQRYNRMLFDMGAAEQENLPEPTAMCEQVEYLTTVPVPVDVQAFRRSYAEHILGCRRCLRFVPRRISPALLLG